QETVVSAQQAQQTAVGLADWQEPAEHQAGQVSGAATQPLQPQNRNESKPATRWPTQHLSVQAPTASTRQATFFGDLSPEATLGTPETLPPLQVGPLAGVIPEEKVVLPVVSAAGHLEQLEQRLRQYEPELLLDERVQLALASTYRDSPRNNDAIQIYRRLAARGIADRNRRAARREQWLMEPSLHAPAGIWRGVLASEPPRLDGKFDDPLWSNAAPISFPVITDDRYETAAKLAYDDAFVYLAVTCRKHPNLKYSSSEGARPRDPDLTAEDRVVIKLDINRDYQSWFELAVDSRGWVSESCLGNRRWNPKWFVAADQGEWYWSVEAAIPRQELSLQELASKTPWAVQVQRYIPSVGSASWAGAAPGTNDTSEFGCLVFD
ncbi:MAG: hypothetical protein KDA51_11090, partial [Planctomycetales bacterium]|nr:hypothetical protein [Planctomycetales bacterium]